MSKLLEKAGRILLLAAGLGLAALGVLVMVTAAELALKLTAALVFASGIIILLLALIYLRLDGFKTSARYLQYLTQVAEYMARLVRDITEVMKAIEEAEAEERSKKEQHKGGNKSPSDPVTEMERELESTVRQFEV
jgi:hypothetical protein